MAEFRSYRKYGFKQKSNLFELKGKVINKDWDTVYSISKKNKNISVLRIAFAVYKGKRNETDIYPESEIFFITAFGHPKSPEENWEGLAERFVKKVKFQDRVRLKGYLSAEEWIGKDGQKREGIKLILSDFEILMQYYKGQRFTNMRDEERAMIDKEVEALNLQNENAGFVMREIDEAETEVERTEPTIEHAETLEPTEEETETDFKNFDYLNDLPF